MSPIPVALVGRVPEILDKIRKDLMPEYDAIHLVYTIEKASIDLPLLLSNPPKTPEDSSSNAGSQNYGVRPQAVFIGGSLDDAAVKQMRDACKDVDKDVIWIKSDAHSWPDMPPLSDKQGFGAMFAKRGKAKLNELGVPSGTPSNPQELHIF